MSKLDAIYYFCVYLRHLSPLCMWYVGLFFRGSKTYFRTDYGEFPAPYGEGAAKRKRSWVIAAIPICGAIRLGYFLFYESATCHGPYFFEGVKIYFRTQDGEFPSMHEAALISEKEELLRGSR